jgi:hypothetical protein
MSEFTTEERRNFSVHNQVKKLQRIYEIEKKKNDNWYYEFEAI